MRSNRVTAGKFQALVHAYRRHLLAEALRQADGNRSQAARDLGLTRPYFVKLLRETGVIKKGSGQTGPR
jgi:DNA-binding NtrC family response regulator